MNVRVLTYNIHKCVGGLDRRCDPDRVAETIAHYSPDIVLLQEAETPSRGASLSQPDFLGDRLGLRHRVYFPNVSRRKGRYGNAILSRFPITRAEHIDLSVPFKKRRSVAFARIRLRAASGGARTLNVYNLHLGLSGLERKIQLRRFLRSEPFSGLHFRAPIIVAGDFNDVWGTLGRKVLEPAGLRPASRLLTFPAFAPLRPLDTFYVRGDIEIDRAQKAQLGIARRASDHLPVIADMRLG